MSSLQSHCFRLILKYWFAPKLDGCVSLTQQRATVKKLQKWAIKPTQVQINPTTIANSNPVANSNLVANIPAEWLIPPTVNQDQVMLYLHGGGYALGSPTTHRDMIAFLAVASGVRALSIDYRLAPEHPFPAALEDATAAYQWLLKQGVAPHNIVIAGDSAGGGLTIATLVHLQQQNIPLPAAAVCISPWVDLAITGESIITRARTDPWLRPSILPAMVSHYLNGNSPCTPLASPLYANLQGLCPLLIHVGSDEILLSDAERLTDRARQAGVAVTLTIWPHMWHVWHFFARFMPEAQQAVNEMGAFIRTHLGKL